jgi:hypothetical protein
VVKLSSGKEANQTIMKSFLIIAFTILSTILLVGCQRRPNEKELQRLVVLASNSFEKEFCTTQFNGDDPTSSEIKTLLSDLNYDCCSLHYKSKGEIEDSVLVLTSRQWMEVETLYYDFAKRDRELKTWNYPNAAEKRVKLENRIYLQTSGFD